MVEFSAMNIGVVVRVEDTLNPLSGRLLGCSEVIELPVLAVEAIPLQLDFWRDFTSNRKP